MSAEDTKSKGKIAATLTTLLLLLAIACTAVDNPDGDDDTPPRPIATATPTIAPPPAGPTATPTARPNQPTPTPPSGDGKGSSVQQVQDGCPTLQTARGLFLVDVTRINGEPGKEEPCAYTMNTGSTYNAQGNLVGGEVYRDVRLATDWFGTTAEPDGLVWVTDGDNRTVKAKAATWRFKPKYPGLTLQSQVDRTKSYAPGAGYDPSIINPRGGATASDANRGVAASASLECPSFAGVQTTPIEGGCLYKGGLVTGPVPQGWKAYYGQPAKWQESGNVSATQVSFYPA